MAYQDRGEWSCALNRALEDALAGRPELSRPEEYRFKVRACRKHGSACACVTWGEVLEHVRWEDTDPVGFVRSRLDALLPPPGKIDG